MEQEAPEDEPGTLKELAEAEIKLSTLLLDISAYKRRFSAIWKHPMGFFHRPGRTDADQLKPGVTFMLQGVTLAFILFTASWSLPRAVAGWIATPGALIAGSTAEIHTYAGRMQEVNRALPADLAKTWREQEELMLATRVLPEERFRWMLARLADLKESNPELLELAVDGSLARGERFGGRHFILTFFLALDPRRGTLLHQTWQLTSIGQQHELPPHVDFLLRSILLWSLTGFLVSRLMPRSGSRAPFVLGAFLVGFLSPLYQVYVTVVHLYLAAALPSYIRYASGGLDPGLAGGVFPFENLMLLAVRSIGFLLFVGFAAAALAAGLRGACAVSRDRAWTAAAIGVGLGLGLVEVAAVVLTLILAPTGLLS